MLHEETNEGGENRLYFPEIVQGAERDTGLSLSIMARFISSGNFSHEQVSPNVAVHVMRSGQGTIRTEEASFDVEAGHVFTFFPETYYRYGDRQAKGAQLGRLRWSYAWCVLDGSQAIEALSMVGITPENPHLRGNVADSLEDLFGEVEETYLLPDCPPAFPTASAWRLIDLLGRAAPAASTSPERNVAELARRLIDHSFMTGLTVDDIARRLEVDRSTLFRKFRRSYRISPKEYLDSVRLSRARQLLRQSRSTVKEVAAYCGFDDSHYFSRVYKKAYGYPPSIERSSDIRRE